MSAHKNRNRQRLRQLQRGKEVCENAYYGKLALLETKQELGIIDERLRKRVLRLREQMKNRGAL